ncbi:Acyl-CoA desaturase [Rhizoctonia solani]|uniref:Acyl-CoA desaturase n=1 Tax=Rhizoctonia solani TaxID=456999 RepID=A0A8H7IED4_9AGAM|nr:Acyl-CoA desaturase [Rhizoctonia solani]
MTSSDRGLQSTTSDADGNKALDLIASFVILDNLHMSVDIQKGANDKPQRAPIWWSNAIFFVSMHIVAVLGVYYYPVWVAPRKTIALCILSWQLASFGITIGYHRLWSHKSFTARRPLRAVLAVMGALGFQGSIKWWCLRHRLHHRFTDDPIHDPYAATRGLWYAHVGWIFRKPVYERMSLVNKDDLEADPVVQIQHRFYIPIAAFFGLVTPTLIAKLWGDALGGYLYGGVVARIMIWHCTFMINSLAHWDGLQPYTNEVTARGNLHAFPHDFRNGPCPQDWDPSKWIIWALHQFTPLVTRVRRAREEDVSRARRWMSYAHSLGKDHLPHGWEALSDEDFFDAVAEVENENEATDQPQKEEYEAWDLSRLESHVLNERRTVVLIDGWVVDVTKYMSEHPGGAALLGQYSFKSRPGTPLLADVKKDLPQDASWAFNGGMNNHTRTARARMRSMRIARLIQ